MSTHRTRRSRTAALIAVLGVLILAAAVSLGATRLLAPSTQEPASTSDGAASDSGAESDGAPPTEAGDDPTRSEEPADGDSPVPNTVERTDGCPSATATVHDAGTLRTALENARPGDVIALAPGTYDGEFVAQADGSEDAPITLCGNEDAVLDGGEPDGGYTLHLDGASHWHLLGFRVTGGQKGVMLDDSHETVVEGLTVSDIGDEGIHLRTHSSHNTVVGNRVSHTGLRKPKFGEGIYVGSAESNWEDLTGGEPDTSDGNLIEDNQIDRVTAEAVDIKEGTTGGILRNNSFDGSEMTDDDFADSWVDVKGNDWLIEGNSGTASSADGYQTHEILDGWGTGNVFRHNSADMEGGGHGFSLTPPLENVVDCSNDVTNAKEGLANIACTKHTQSP